ncbi:hypothetical protein K437DRAFT_106884 [Tilletiaria anomala UBC 951]|uniref:Uncharacterized protein n=1 Tax=Tilletiaria anomala (strain ATCC 24038 / CBS 436.72 / UBC 951) TaxID=1037660 RepID=A0A066VY30_TILAU|nr:uncharacterized protein K437DRAFT_106884 [Tilletiaria anomala UBC 951]KDN46647.1 hypothetical protein K437DRAFT_106884 [Tilletiaria anomala UBC 951]
MEASDTMDTQDEAVAVLQMWNPGTLKGSSSSYAGGSSSGSGAGAVLAKTVVPGVLHLKKRLPGSSSSSGGGGHHYYGSGASHSSIVSAAACAGTPRCKRETIIASSKLDPFGSTPSPSVKERPSRSRLATTASSSSNGMGSIGFADVDATEAPQLIPGPQTLGINGSDLIMIGSPAHGGSSVGSGGSWRKVTVVFRQHGVLSIYSEEKALLHSTLISDLTASEVRRVDDSIFLRPNIIAVSSRVSTLARSVGASACRLGVGVGCARGKQSPVSNAFATSGASPGGLGEHVWPSSGNSAGNGLFNDDLGCGSSPGSGSGSFALESILLAFPSRIKMQRWLMALQAYAVPEIYLSDDKITMSRLGSMDAAVSDQAQASTSPMIASPTQSMPKLHRINRSIKISVIEARGVSSDSYTHQQHHHQDQHQLHATQAHHASPIRKRTGLEGVSVGGFDSVHLPMSPSGSLAGRIISRKSSSTTNTSDNERRSSTGTHGSDGQQSHTQTLPPVPPPAAIAAAGAGQSPRISASRRRSLLNPKGDSGSCSSSSASGTAAAPDGSGAPPSRLRGSGSVPSSSSPSTTLDQITRIQKSRTASDLVPIFSGDASLYHASGTGTGTSDSFSISPTTRPELSAPLELKTDSTQQGASTARDMSRHHLASEESDSDKLDSGPIAGMRSGSSWAHWTTAGSVSPHSMALLPPRRDSNTSSAFSSSIGGGSENAWHSCRIYVNGVLLARTSFKSSQDGLVWMEDFHFETLPTLRRLQIEVLQQTTGRGGAMKQVPLGLVTLPVETIRRGEDIEGWFPVWSISEEKDADAASRFDLGARELVPFAQEVVGEIKLNFKISELIVLPTARYAAIEKALNGPERSVIIQHLAATAGENTLLSSVIQYGIAKGQIVALLTDLAKMESEKLGNDPDKDLLFRGNTALSRSLDKFQQFCCTSWLEVSIGEYIHQICAGDTGIDLDELLSSNKPRPHPFSALHTNEDQCASPTLFPASVEHFQEVVTRIWANIYRQRHQCPAELREVLFHLRSLVNARFTATGTGSGIQGVGAFVFLRLICPAITSPQLFGLLQASPSPSHSKLLLMIAKVFLALANKKTEFDKDKEPVLSSLNFFLKEQASTYDDFITFVSTVDSAVGSRVHRTHRLLDEDDEEIVQRFQAQRKSKFIPIHSDSLPNGDYALDQPLLLATLSADVTRIFGISSQSSHDFLTSLVPQEHIKSPTFAEFVAACSDVETQSQALLHLTSVGLCSTLKEQTPLHGQTTVISSVVARRDPQLSPTPGGRSRFFARKRSATISGANARGGVKGMTEDLARFDTALTPSSYNSASLMKRHSNDLSHDLVPEGLNAIQEFDTTLTPDGHANRKKKWWRI